LRLESWLPWKERGTTRRPDFAFSPPSLLLSPALYLPEFEELPISSG
jgi:hypothetical protein